MLKQQMLFLRLLKIYFDYINNLPRIKEEMAKISEQIDFKIKNLIEVKKANLIFLNDLTDAIKKRQITFVNINPADLIKKDGDLSLEIMNLQIGERITVGILAPPSITGNLQIRGMKQIIMILPS